MIRIIKNGSVATWQYINFFGSYDFSPEEISKIKEFDINRILELKFN